MRTHPTTPCMSAGGGGGGPERGERLWPGVLVMIVLVAGCCCCARYNRPVLPGDSVPGTPPAPLPSERRDPPSTAEPLPLSVRPLEA